MRIVRRIAAAVGICVIPFVVGFPVALLPAGPAGSTPREALLAQISAALQAAEPTPVGIGIIPALIAVGILIAGTAWLAFRPGPRRAPDRASREARAELALELMRDGEPFDRVRVKARLSREAIELLSHTTMGHPA